MRTTIEGTLQEFTEEIKTLSDELDSLPAGRKNKTRRLLLREKIFILERLETYLGHTIIVENPKHIEMDGAIFLKKEGTLPCLKEWWGK